MLMKERDTPHPVSLRKETMTNIARRTAQKVMMTMTSDDDDDDDDDDDYGRSGKGYNENTGKGYIRY
jgi:hypothetical protein